MAIKIVQICDKCKAESEDIGFLVEFQVKTKWNLNKNYRNTHDTNASLCRDCLVAGCGLVIPPMGDNCQEALAQLNHPTAADMLLQALGDFIAENLPGGQ